MRRAMSSAHSISEDAERAVDALLAERVETIAVCLLHSYANPVHELAIRDVIGAARARHAGQHLL